MNDETKTAEAATAAENAGEKTETLENELESLEERLDQLDDLLVEIENEKPREDLDGSFENLVHPGDLHDIGWLARDVADSQRIYTNSLEAAEKRLGEVRKSTEARMKEIRSELERRQPCAVQGCTSQADARCYLGEGAMIYLCEDHVGKRTKGIVRLDDLE